MKTLLATLTFLFVSSAFAAEWSCLGFVRDEFMQEIDLTIVATGPQTLQMTRKKAFGGSTYSTQMIMQVKGGVITALGGIKDNEPTLVELELKKSGDVAGKTFFDGSYVEYDKAQNGKASLVAVNFECEFIK